MVRHADSSDEATFRALVKTITSGSGDRLLVVSYDRGVLQQSGTGHFTPIGGYNAEKDMVLLLDVARFKYPPHWITLSLCWQSMLPMDPDTGRSRGYVVLERGVDADEAEEEEPEPSLVTSYRYTKDGHAVCGRGVRAYWARAGRCMQVSAGVGQCVGKGRSEFRCKRRGSNRVPVN